MGPWILIAPESFWAQIVWILMFIWRPVKCFWTQKRFLNQNHFWILKIFGPNAVLRNKICLRSKFCWEPKFYLELHSILQSEILVKLKKIGFIFTNYFLPSFCSGIKIIFGPKIHLLTQKCVWNNICWTQHPFLDKKIFCTWKCQAKIISQPLILFNQI